MINRKAVKSAGIGVIAILAAIALHLSRERFDFLQLALLFAGSAWIVITLIVWVIDGLEAR